MKAIASRMCGALVAWLVGCSLLASIGAAGATSAGATTQVREGGVNESGARVLAGADRYATSVLLAERALEALRRTDGRQESTGRVVVASGESLVDALSAVPLAAVTGGAVVLTKTAELPKVVADLVRAHDIDGLSLVGGTDAVSDAVAQRLTEVAGTGVLERFAGVDRYETAVAVARAADALREQQQAHAPASDGLAVGMSGGWCGETGKAVLVVNGSSLVDGVLTAPVAYAMRLPVLFTRTDALPSVVRDYLTEAGVAHTVLVGSNAEVSRAVVSELAALSAQVTRIDGDNPAARSVALADAVSACGVASNDFALLDANQPVDGVTAAALLATGIDAANNPDARTSDRRRSLVPVLAVDDDLPAEVADHLSARASANRGVTLYALGGTARITPALMRDALDAAKSNIGTPDRSVAANTTVRNRNTNTGHLSSRPPTLTENQPSRTSTVTTSTTTTEAPPTTTATTVPGTTSTSSSTTSTTASVATTSTSEPTTTSTTPTTEATTTTTTADAVAGSAATSTTVPPNSFTDVNVGTQFSCGLRADGSIGCWLNFSGDTFEAPAGPYVSLAVGPSLGCAVGTDHTIACWSSSGRLEVPPLEGEFLAVAVGEYHFCALRADRRVECWGGNWAGQSDAPQGSFSAVAVGERHSCGLRVDGTVACWGSDTNFLGSDSDGRLDAPSGAFQAVSVGTAHSCGLRTDGTISCWGFNEHGQTDPPGGTFVEVDAGGDFTCGRRVNGSVECWGSHRYGRSEPPPSKFTAISAGRIRSCGVLLDGTVQCWGAWSGGLFDVAGAPGVRPNGADVCRPYGPEGFSSFGPANDWPADVRDGVFDVLVVFAEFGDARHDPDSLTPAARQTFLADVETYIETQSYGRLDVEFTVVPEWVAIGETYADYLAPRPHRVTGWRYLDEMTSWRAVQEAKQFVDVTNGGQRFDSLLLVMPPSHFRSGLAPDSVPIDAQPHRDILGLRSSGAPTIRASVVVGAVPRDAPQHGATPSVFVAAHELLHNLGLNDLYDYDDQSLNGEDNFVPPTGRAYDYVHARYGPMGLNAWWPGIDGSPFHFPAPGPARPADGSAVTDTTVLNSVRPIADEMLGWARWRLDWLTRDQVDCAELGTRTVRLAPLAAPDGGTALAVVPLARQQMLVLEARRRVGYDADQLSDDGNDYHRRLPEEGVLVYLVQPGVISGGRAITLFGDDHTGLVPQSPILTVGETVTFSGTRDTFDLPYAHGRQRVLGSEDSARARRIDGPIVAVSITGDDGTNFTVKIDWTQAKYVTSRYDYDVTRTTAAANQFAPPLGSSE